MKPMLLGVTVSVYNLDHEPRHNYIVVRRDEETAKLWWYGSYETEEKANRVAVEIGNGIVLKR